MAEAKRERGIKVMVKRRIWIEEDGVPAPKVPGEILVLTKDQVKHFGEAVTRDLPLDEEDED